MQSGKRNRIIARPRSDRANAEFLLHPCLVTRISPASELTTGHQTPAWRAGFRLFGPVFVYAATTSS